MRSSLPSIGLEIYKSLTLGDVERRKLGVNEFLMREGVRANVRASVDHLRHGSELLERLIRDDGLMVIGAEYSLETGLVDFFDGVPTPETVILDGYGVAAPCSGIEIGAVFAKVIVQPTGVDAGVAVGVGTTTTFGAEEMAPRTPRLLGIFWAVVNKSLGSVSNPAFRITTRTYGTGTVASGLST